MTVKRQAPGAQIAQRMLVKGPAATLVLHLSVPGEAQLLKSSLDFIGAAGQHARAVEVFDAQQPPAAMVARVKKTAERRD